MFKRTFLKSILMVAALTIAGSGCFEDVTGPSLSSSPSEPFVAEVEPGIGTEEVVPCSASPDLVPNGRIDGSDLAHFTVLQRKQDPRADFTGNGLVNDADRRVLEFFLGQPYTHDCSRSIAIPAGCTMFASPDISGNGWIDGSDLAAFAASRANPSLADFNGDGVVNLLDQIVLEERLGQEYRVRHYANPDLNGDGWVNGSDLAVFAARGSHPSVDFTHNGIVNENDKRVLEYMLGRAYEVACGQVPAWTLVEGCIQYASPDINGSGWVDGSDLAAFYSGTLTLAQGDFNGDGVIDALDEIILLERLGTQNHLPRCGEA